MGVKTSIQTEYQKAPSFGVYHDPCYAPREYDDPPTTRRTREHIDAAQSAELARDAICGACWGNIHEPPILLLPDLTRLETKLR